MIFGSDYPLILYPKTEDAPGWRNLLAEIAGSGLTPEEQASVLGGNIARLLGL